MRHSPLAAELRDAITPRAFFLMVGVLLVQLGFLLSYVGAFHHPDAQRIPLAVAAPAEVAERLDGLRGEPVETTLVRDRGEARERIMNRDAQGAYVMDQQGTQDILLIASAAGSSVAQAITEVGSQFAKAQQRTVRTEDVAPANAGDRGSLSAFYLVIGWLVGGYLAASMLGITAGARPANTRRAVLRLAVMVVYAALSGLGGALIVDQALGALPGHFLALWGIGTLVVLAAGAATIALQVMFGVIGIGLAIVVFVVLGNPSAGGAYQRSMIPPFWRTIGDWLPPGAGTTAVRHSVYFDGNAMAGPMWVLAVWTVAGVLLTLFFAARHRDTEPPALGPYHPGAST
ncbi:SNG1 family protein [Streptomyces sp. N2-109]|uniref:SNG1 family protein n=1 Tax=Streptomyces gossypii TaxID=2883101 RepID=A0ABT2JV26_9ACTN|nr:SNG1 family protein [Streptomyces gossypii]MCT2591205.1 SNG1 family protein [Streptomyces gossypii]